MVKTNTRKWKQNVVFCATCAILVANVSYAGNVKARQLVAGDKAKVTGTIVPRDGDLVCIREGVGNAKGQLNASTISFNPDEFAIEVT